MPVTLPRLNENLNVRVLRLSIQGTTPYVVPAMAFSPDSSKLAIAQTDAIVFVYKVRMCQPIDVPPLSERSVVVCVVPHTAGLGLGRQEEHLQSISSVQLCDDAVLACYSADGGVSRV